MAQRYYTLPLHEATFPMLSEQQSRTIIGGSESSDPGANAQKPKVHYCHNVMPTVEGLISVGYNETVPVYSPAISNLVATRELYASDRSRVYISWGAGGEAYALEEGSSFWRPIPDTVPSTLSVSFDPNDVTFGSVNGITYMWHKFIGCFLYNIATHSFDSVILTGIAIASTLGVSGSSGYLLAYTKQAVAWSSTLDPTDFTPSQVTGAGGGNVAELGGSIRFVLPNTVGILIYADTNVVVASYTGNVQYPFKFREVDDSKGGLTLDLVAHAANSLSQYVFSKGGLQGIASNAAKLILPGVSDFLAGKVLEDFNESTMLIEKTELSAPMLKKVRLIASRYLVISYGATSYTHAIVYDIALKRLGKLKVTHVDCFEYVGQQEEVSRESIAFLSANGVVRTLNFSTVTDTTGVVIMGKLQYIRGRFMTLQGVDVETIKSASSLSVATLASLDGKTTALVPGFIGYSAEGIRKYFFLTSALNHSILLIGQFDLTSLYITYDLGARV